MGITVLSLIEVLLLAFVATKLFRMLRADGISDLNAPVSVKVAFRLVGVLNLALCGVGTYFLFQSIVLVRQTHKPDSEVSYFWAAFIVLTIINALLIGVLASTSIRLIQVTKNAALSYCVFVSATLLYSFLNGGLWLAPDPMGKSIAAATGVGNMGIAPFESFLFPIRGWTLSYVYPLVSAAVVFAVHKRLCRQRTASAG